MSMETRIDQSAVSAENNTAYTAPTIQTITLAALWRRLGPAVALSGGNGNNLFESLVPSDPADGLFDD